MLGAVSSLASTVLERQRNAIRARVRELLARVPPVTMAHAKAHRGIPITFKFCLRQIDACTALLSAVAMFDSQRDASLLAKRVMLVEVPGRYGNGIEVWRRHVTAEVAAEVEHTEKVCSGGKRAA